MRLRKIIGLLVLPGLLNAQHPVTFFTKAEAREVKNNLAKYPLLSRSYQEIKEETDQFIGRATDVPFPKDPAGGYTHERHKANYTLMFNSGVLYNLTNDIKYAKLVKDILLKYAALNPTLKNHPQATSSSPGHLFWQALNDANWLVYSGMAYDLIYNSLSASEKKTIEDGAFKPEVDFFTKDLKSWFNLIHNHGVWACAGVGIVGIATNNKDYVDMALYGTEKDGKSGFLAQMNGLFSPDGYYTEGPYYVRYAILPYYLFANALDRARPGLKIFQYRNAILQKALTAGLQQTNLDGRFFPLNDAIKDKDYTSNELITAVDIAWNEYGNDEGLLVVAKKQDRVLLNKGGMAIAAALAKKKSLSPYYSYRSVEYTDGKSGDEGGVSLLRAGGGADLTTLIFKYSSHGLSHGHFDKLNINLFDKGNEILTDYGSARFVGVEQKYGGRYLPENKSYASQTITHNTIVVDETSQFNGKEDESEKHHSENLFSNIGKASSIQHPASSIQYPASSIQYPASSIQHPVSSIQHPASSIQYPASSIQHPASSILVVAAKEDNAYKNVHLQRTEYLVQLPQGRRMIVDLFNASSRDEHQYDLPFQFSGQLINTSFKYESFVSRQQTLGKKNGYQFLWKEAEARSGRGTVQFTFLSGNSFYSVSSLVEDSASLYFTRSGANDPDFNLRHEPAFIIRKKGTNQSFISVIEIHGKYDPVTEMATNAYPSVKAIRMLQNDESYSIAEISIEDKKLLIAQSNNDFDTAKKHLTKDISWTGPYAVWYDGKILN